MAFYFHVDLVVRKIGEMHCLLQCLGSLFDTWAVHCLFQKVVQIGAMHRRFVVLRLQMSM
jgi:hypothetical protein